MQDKMLYETELSGKKRLINWVLKNAWGANYNDTKALTDIAIAYSYVVLPMAEVENSISSEELRNNVKDQGKVIEFLKNLNKICGLNIYDYDKVYKGFKSKIEELDEYTTEETDLIVLNQSEKKIYYAQDNISLDMGKYSEYVDS